MDPRNYLAHASGTPPTKPASPSQGYPQSAVPGVSEATIPGPHWFYKVGEELRALISGSGLTPSDDNLGQVLAGLKRFAGAHVTTLDADTTVGPQHAGLVFVDATAGNVTITLPPASDLASLTYRFKRLDDTANTVTIAPDGTIPDTINGKSSWEIPTTGGLYVESDGVDEFVSTAPRELRNVRVLTTGTAATYTPPTWCRAIEPTVVGAGGGAGGCDGQGAGTAVTSMAGSGGAWCSAFIGPDELASSYTYTVGAGGTGGAAGANDGADGGASSFSDGTLTLSAPGGPGGAGHTGTGGAQAGGTDSMAPATGGDINGSGVPATGKNLVSGFIGMSSTSGICPLIGGGVPTTLSGNGADATQFGEGGGASRENDSTANYAGGDGYSGVIIVKEFG